MARIPAFTASESSGQTSQTSRNSSGLVLFLVRSKLACPQVFVSAMVVESANGLLNRRTGIAGTAGSNPALSVTKLTNTPRAPVSQR